MQAWLFINLLGFEVFSNLFRLGYFDLLQACWQPSCSTADYGFYSARMKPKLL